MSTDYVSNIQDPAWLCLTPHSHREPLPLPRYIVSGNCYTMDPCCLRSLFGIRLDKTYHAAAYRCMPRYHPVYHPPSRRSGLEASLKHPGKLSQIASKPVLRPDCLHSVRINRHANFTVWTASGVLDGLLRTPGMLGGPEG